MRKVVRIILTGIAICTVAVPDMGSEFLKKLKRNIRDFKDRSEESIHYLTKGMGKSSAEKSR
jgi:hypothetical protein